MANDYNGKRQRDRRAVRRVLVSVAEITMVAFLLLVDFGLGVSFIDGRSKADMVVAALSTSSVVGVVTLIALCRRMLPVTGVVAAAFGVSVAASVTAAAIGNPGISLTEVVALGTVTVFAVQQTSSRSVYFVAGTALVVAVSYALFRVGFDVTPLLLAVLAWGCSIALGSAARYLRGRRNTAVEEARRLERMELARELHDVVAHQVTGIVVQAQAAIVVAQKNPDQAGRALASIETAGGEALLGMRRMVGALRETSDEESAVLTVPSGLGDMAALIERFDPAGEQVRLRIEMPVTTLPAGIGETAYRVVRESLTNVRRHALSTARVDVLVRVTGAELVVTVCNDAVRHRPDINVTSQGFGLIGISERVGALGGTFNAGPKESNSWLVRVVLPVGLHP